MALPILAAFDWRYAVAVALGLVAGWFCRAAVPYAERKPWREIRHQLVLSLMISGGSLIATLYLSDLVKADAIGAAGIAWAVAFGGLDTLRIVHRFVLHPIMQAVGSGAADSELGKERQRLAEAEAARSLASKSQDEGDMAELLQRLSRAQRRKLGDGPPLPSHQPDPQDVTPPFTQDKDRHDGTDR